jgi:hypothetical protein
MARSGHAEAIHHFSVALDLLSKLGEKPDSAATELDLCVKLGPALAMVKRPGSPEVEAIYRSAAALEAGENSSARFKALWGLLRTLARSGRSCRRASRARAAPIEGARLSDNARRRNVLLGGRQRMAANSSRESP